MYTLQQRNIPYGKWIIATLVLLALALLPLAAMASQASTGMPWENPLQSFMKSISGPVAFGIEVIAIVGCGAALIWGGEINEFLRRGILVVLVGGLIMFAVNIVQTLYSGGAATITPIAMQSDVADRP